MRKFYNILLLSIFWMLVYFSYFCIPLILECVTGAAWSGNSIVFLMCYLFILAPLIYLQGIQKRYVKLLYQDKNKVSIIDISINTASLIGLVLGVVLFALFHDQRLYSANGVFCLWSF
jgi:hypothetical protein